MWVRNSTENSGDGLSLFLVIWNLSWEDLMTAGDLTAGGWNYLDVPSLTCLVLATGCWLKPQLIFYSEDLQVATPFGLSPWASLGFLTIWCLRSLEAKKGVGRLFMTKPCISHSIISTMLYEPRWPPKPTQCKSRGLDPTMWWEDYQNIFRHISKPPKSALWPQYYYLQLFTSLPHTKYTHTLSRTPQTLMPLWIRLRIHLNQIQVHLSFSDVVLWVQLLEHCFNWPKECISGGPSRWLRSKTWRSPSSP